MFLPMSCTSPFTVASRILPRAETSPAFAFSASMNGSSHATAFFITRALLTTCGRNILPAPKRLPTTFIPFISGPSMIERALGYFVRASSRSGSRWSMIPFTSACERRSSTGPLRHASFSFAVRTSACPLIDSANCVRRSVAAVEQHVLDELEEVFRDLLVDRQLAGVDDAHRQPGVDGVVEKRGVHRL